MKLNSETIFNEDFFVSSIRSQVNVLCKLLKHIESGNPINEYTHEDIRLVEKELRWVRNFYFNN
ncbi:MAG: hypothetical protein A2Z88_09275 [Omnitrophica WOR_2 bacterium GWA2_47_8]|nr:MAG: hypothetical protein A2Z88_09275 [Omnitrophica WOR_2 bacterium GWA2_47_8]